VCRVVALPAPNDRERTQWYFQRYVPHLPAAGERQHLRFLSCIHDPLKPWKLSLMDLESRHRWEAYTEAKEAMLERTHISEAPWWLVHAVDKRTARLNCIHHLLRSLRGRRLWLPSPACGRGGTSSGATAKPSAAQTPGAVRPP
jgi:polyphosphate kinase 2 (PPK2 family)